MNFSDTKIVPTGNRFDIYTPLTSGLSLRVRGGEILTATGIKAVQGGESLTLTASADNYIEVSDAGVVSVETAFTDGATELYVVTTSATVITGIEDRRGGSRSASAIQAVTASGAIRADAELVTLDSTTPKIEATVAAPRAGRWLVITQIDGGTAGHTVTLSAGTYNGTNTIATLNAAGETLVLYGLTATLFAVVENIGSVGLSGP